MNANVLYLAALLTFTTGCNTILHAQNAIAARGTGRTTGHIADISVTNTFKNPIVLLKTEHSGVARYALHDPVRNNTFSITGRHNDRSDMYLIPSQGKYQSYVVISLGEPVPAIANNTINPGETIIVPAIGYCVDIHRPPVELAVEMPGVSGWVHSADVSIPRLINPEITGVSINTDKKPDYVASNIPGQNVNQPFVINASENPQLFAALIFDAVDKILITTDVLQQNGVINTPFSSNHEKERESVVQQTLWWYASALTGSDYSKNDFAEKMTTQFETNTGTKIQSATNETKNTLNEGIDNFWSAFELVGVEAKVLANNPNMSSSLPADVKDKLENAFNKDISEVKPHTDSPAKAATETMGADAVAKGDSVAFGSSPDIHTAAHELAHSSDTSNRDEQNQTVVLSENENVKAQPSCKCKEFTAKVVVVNGDIDAIKPGREPFDLKAEVGKSGSFPSSDEYEVPFNYPLKKGDVINISFSDIKLKCACEEVPCETIHGKDPRNTAQKFLEESRGKINVKNTNNTSKVLLRDKDYEAHQSGTSATFKFNAENNNSANETIHFQLQAYCSGAENCARDHCLYNIKIKLKINQKE